MISVGFDIDGVIADQVGAFNRYAEKACGERFEATYYDWYDQYPDGYRLFGEFISDPEQMALVEPFDGAANAMQLFTKLGYDLCFITYRPQCVLDATLEWLERHGMAVGPVYCERDKTKVPTDIFFDDHAETVASFLIRGRQAYVFDRPWNRHAELPRVREWGDVYRRLADRKLALA